MKGTLGTAALATLLFAKTATASGPLTQVGDLQPGTHVTVAGIVERITDEDEFRLADTSGSVRIYIGPNWVPARVGEAVTVAGFVDDDSDPIEIYAQSVTRQDGTHVTFDYDYD